MSDNPPNTPESTTQPWVTGRWRIALAIAFVLIVAGPTIWYLNRDEEAATPPPSPTTAELHIERGTTLGTAQVDGKIVCDSSHDPVKLVDDETVTYNGVRISSMVNTSEYRIFFTDSNAIGYDSVIVKGTVAAPIPQAIPPAFVKEAVLKVSAFGEVAPVRGDIVLCASRSAIKPGS